MATAVAGPASAARQINPPAWFVCNRYPAKISISPPRVWASQRPEQALWLIAIERWNRDTQRWYKYYDNPFRFLSTFNYYGQGIVAWRPLGNFVNSTMNLPVKHVGYYRVASVVNSNGGGSKSGYIGGSNNNCYVR